MMMKSLTFLVGLGVAHATQSETGANPIRRVVTLLQDMQKELEAEGDKEKELYNKYMCYCKTNTEGMGEAAKAAAEKIAQLNADIKAMSAEKAQLVEELKQHKKDRSDAKQDLAKATKIREKEHEGFVAASGETKENIDALNGAVSALEKGMGAKSFIQTPQASLLSKVLQRVDNIDASDRETLMAFMQATTGQNPYGDYAPAGGQIVGILKNMKDEMDKSLGGIVADEESAASGFAALKAAKQKEIAAATSAIESKTSRSGELAVRIVNAKNDMTNTTKDMEESQAFMADLSVSCGTKTSEFEEREKTRNEEVTAISEVISMLNDDDALDLFKDSLGSKKNSFIQKDVTKAQKAKALLSKVVNGKRVPMALNLLAHTAIARLGGLQKEGVKVDFSKVLKMIDDMVVLLNQEQKDDDKHLNFCNGEFANTSSELKDLGKKLEGIENAISELQAAISDAADEIAKKEQEIKDLDKSVAEATEQRKSEHKEYIAGEELNAAAVDLLGKAKNRLHKFYNPNLYKAPTTQAPTEEERIAAGAMSFLQVAKKSALRGSAKVWARPDAFEGQGDLDSSVGTEYKQKGQKANSVVALVDMLVKELQTDIQEAEHEEKTAQRDYSKLMEESAEQRRNAQQSITERQGAKADSESQLEAQKTSQITTNDELETLKKYESELHASCDFLVANYDVRKAARTSEADSLKNAKAVLSGADFQ